MLLIIALCLQTTVPPFATDTYTPAIPQVTEQLSPTAPALVGLTLTAFFIGMAAGQLIGGPISDARGRRLPMLVGGVICLAGAIGCAVAPSIGALITFRVMQGVGGGIAAVVARAVVVDVATGDLLPKVMSLMMAIGGLAPMIAPLLGGITLALGGSWRSIFWVLTALAVLMLLAAALVVPESLPPERRSSGGLRTFARGVSTIVHNRTFVGFLLLNACSGFAMMAYISNSSYVLQEMKGLPPLAFSFFFAGTALSQVLLSVVNARLVGRVAPRTLIRFGLTVSTTGVALLVISVALLDTALIPTCAGFLLLMSAQAFVFGNSGSLAAAEARHVAGAASALLGVGMAGSMAISAPLATSGGGTSAVPMVVVMVLGVTGAWACLLLVARDRRTSAS